MFDLHTTGSGGSGRGIAIEDAFLAWGSRRRPFEDIATVRLWADLYADGPFALCEIIFADGERLRLMVGDADFNPRKGMKYAEYRAFVLEFFERLNPAQRARIVFTEGPSAARRISWIVFSAGGLAAFLAIAVIGLAANWFDATDNNWLLLPLNLFFAALMAGMLLFSLKSGQRTFDPSDVPRLALPPVLDRAKPGV